MLFSQTKPLLHKVAIGLLALLSFFCALPTSVSAQNSNGKIEITQNDYSNQSVEMADVFRQDGKIYVVVVVILTLLFGIFVYLFWLEKRLTKLEKDMPESNMNR